MGNGISFVGIRKTGRIILTCFILALLLAASVFLRVRAADLRYAQESSDGLRTAKAEVRPDRKSVV